jgi:cellulose synthase/poly-beta-1,6-N-acetylglucosamine synthase-like glycosyltransferase
MTVISFIAVMGLSLWAVIFGLTLWGTQLTRKRLRTPPPHLDAPFNLFPISVLKPLKGVDANLEQNLEGFFRLDYPDFELLFSVANSSDPAHAVVRRLIERFPGVRARVFVGETVVGPNPKVNNLLKAYETAANDWVLISDSNVRVRPDYLKRLVAHLRPGVGMVTAIVAGQEAAGLGGQLEAAYLNTFYARGMNVAAGLGRSCVVGKCMLFQRSVAKRFGGMRTLGCYLAEDYMAGEAMQRLGLEIVIATDPVEQVIGDYSVDSFWKRHIRWGRIRKKHALSAFLVEPFANALVSGVIGASAFHALTGAGVPLFLMLHLGVWSLCDIAVIRWLGVTLRWTTPIAWFLREMLALPLWLNIASGNTVDWRGHKLALGAGGILNPMSPTSIKN